MANIISSTKVVGHEQKDGRRYVAEIHTVDDGQQYRFEWLWDGQADPDLVLSMRATKLNAQLAVIAASQAVVDGESVPVSYAHFRKQFTDDELQGMDKVDANLDAFGLSDKQIETQRTTLKTISATNMLRLDDQAIRVMLELYVAVGVLEAKRVDEVLVP